MADMPGSNSTNNLKGLLKEKYATKILPLTNAERTKSLGRKGTRLGNMHRYAKILAMLGK